MGGFDVKILAYDKYKSGFGDEHVIEADMRSIFEQADIVSLHIPLTSATNQLVNSDFISFFTKPFRLLNLSRGGIVNLSNVIEAINAHKIIGFATDVLPNEKLKSWSESEKNTFNSIKKFPNTIFSPHVAGWTVESYWKINDVLLEKIKSFYHS